MSMIFITFMFRVPNQPHKTFYGKYCTDEIAFDHAGLDEVIKPYLLKGISEYQKQENLAEVKQKVKIGIMSIVNNKSVSIHSSHEERYCFDFYCENFTINNIKNKINLKMYMFGKIIENPSL